MPLPPYLISVGAFICERVLMEVDGVASAIRMIDIFRVAGVPPEAEKDAPLPVVQMFCVVSMKAKPEERAKHTVGITIINTRGESTPQGDPVVVEFAGKPEFGVNAPGGANIALQLNVAVRRFGTCYVCVFLDGEEVCRTPFTLIPPPPVEQKD